MITRLRANDFKSLVDIDVPLAPLNVLIGPNASGKSNLLDALQVLTYGAVGLLSESLRSFGGVERLRSALPERMTEGAQVSLGVDVSGLNGVAVLSYDVTIVDVGMGGGQISKESLRLQTGERKTPLVLLRRNGRDVVLRNETSDRDDPSITLKNAAELALAQTHHAHFYPHAAHLHTILATLQRYGYAQRHRWEPRRLPQVAADDAVPLPDRSNLPNALSLLMVLDEFKDPFDTLVSRVFPDFKRLHFPPSHAGKTTLKWYSRSLTRALDLSELSDGMVDYMLLLAVLLNLDPPSVICLDEPEVGLHPKMLEIVADLIKAAATRTQLIVTTHSPELVSQFDAETVSVVDKVDGRTIIRQLDTPALEHWLEDFSLGELFRIGHLEED